MERAGLAAADLAGELVLDRCGAILIVAGGGNNGGDAYVCARHLKARGHSVMVASPAATQPLPPDAEAARNDWLAMDGAISDQLPELKNYALAIDGLFGIGLTRPIEGQYADWIARLNSLSCPILALDTPSGLNADTGAIMGCCVQATHTLTFIAAKPGLYTLEGRDHAGEVHCATLDIDASSAATGEGRLISSADFESALQARRHNSHKGSNGSAAIIGGASGMAGAALLSARAALHLGAGRVYVGMLDPIAVDVQQPELMLRSVADAIEQVSGSGGAIGAIGIGPGLGQSDAALAALKLAIAANVPLAIDADALNLIAAHPVLVKHIARRTAATVLTPHPAEAARLLGISTPEVQAQRISNTLQLAKRFNTVVVLKGSGSVVAFPDGNWYINATGNPALGTAGTGDVLLGIVTALLAQQHDASTSLLAAVHLHGAAADALVAAGTGPIGLTAGELIMPARTLWNSWIAAH